MGMSGPGQEALGSRPGRCVCWGWGLGFWHPGGSQAGGVFASPSQTPWEVTPGHCDHSTPSPSESQQEQPVLSLRLQADPRSLLLSPSTCNQQVEPRLCQWSHIHPPPEAWPPSPSTHPQAWSALNLDLSVPLRPLKGEGARGEGRRLKPPTM